MDNRQATILLVEDDDVDAETVERGLKSAGIEGMLVRARDGVEALDLLEGRQGRAKIRPPFLLLVDIRMPRMDGLSLIHAVRRNVSLQRTIIFVLTTSDSERDRLAAYNEHVAGYIIKSGSDDQYLRLAKMLEYYLSIVELPPHAVA
jgi:CheY-like chemotaxis protein